MVCYQEPFGLADIPLTNKRRNGTQRIPVARRTRFVVDGNKLQHSEILFSLRQTHCCHTRGVVRRGQFVNT